MRKRIFIILGCLIILLLVTRWMILIKTSTVEVETVEVHRSEFICKITAQGRISSRNIVTLRSRTNGIMQNIPSSIQVGAKVSKGEFLGEVKTSEEEKRTIQNELKRAKTELEISRRKLALSKQLFELKAISENELIRVKLDYENDKMRVKELEKKLKPQKIISPISGIISEIRVKNGERVSANDNLFTICDMEQLIANLDVGEEDIAKIHKGQKVLIRSEAFPEQLSGQIEMVSMVAQAEKNAPGNIVGPTFTVTVSIANPTGTVLRIGGRVLGTIILERKQNVIAVPLEAVLYTEESRPYLFVYNSGKAIKRMVKIGLSNDESVEIVEGLEPGEKVIISNNIYLKNNTRVKLKKLSTPSYEGF